jgi:hypothetical protein
MSKLCSVCKIEKIKENFSPDNRAKDGLMSQCKDCRKRHTRWIRRNNPWLVNYYSAFARCNNKKHEKFSIYGGRGIKFLLTKEEVKKLWFRDKAWLLTKPSLDRKESDKNYTFDNCQFIEHRINSSKRIY